MNIMKTLISTIWADESPITASITKFRPNKLILLFDKNEKEEQKNTAKEIEGFLKETELNIKIEIEHIEKYDIEKISKEIIKIIDKCKGDEIYIDITASKKTQSFGVAFGTMMRSNAVKRIIYSKEEDRGKIEIPKIFIQFAENEKTILEAISKCKGDKKSIDEVAQRSKLKISTVYKYIKRFREEGLIEDESLDLTPYGKLAIL